MKEVVVAIDQSGSMAESVVYAAVFGATLACHSFDQDLRGGLRHRDRRPHRPAVRPGRRALRLPTRWRHRHQSSAGVLPAIDHSSDRVDPGADLGPLRGRHRRRRCCAASPSCCGLVSRWSCCLPCRIPVRRRTTTSMRQRSRRLGVPAFACTPDLFPDLLAVAVSKGDIGQWAATAASAAAAPSRVAEAR